jgi:hypothetical protein
MSNITPRLQENRGLPAHYIETGYLTDLLIGVKMALHTLPLAEEMRSIDAVFLAEWPLIHRTHFSGCSVFTHDVSHIPLAQDRHDIHREDISRIDVFIKALQQGLSEGQLTRYVTVADTQAITLTLPRLEACFERMRWD